MNVYEQLPQTGQSVTGTEILHLLLNTGPNIKNLGPKKLGDASPSA